LDTIAKVCSEQSHLPMRLLEIPHKGSSELHHLRQMITYAATHYFFYKPSQLAEFFHVAPSSVSRMNSRFRANLLKQPAIEMQLFQSFIQ